MADSREYAAEIGEQIAQLRGEAAGHGGDLSFGRLCAEMLLQGNKDRLLGAFVEASAFGVVSPVESFRRLDLLRALAPGSFCSDKTWGFGVVRAVDDFYKRITIDFDRRRGHQMSLAYAAESLAMVGDDHLLARRHRDPDGLAALVRDKPGEVVRLALHAFGPMAAAKLEATLVEARVVAQGEWKDFWERARRALKGDAQVVIPQKRADPITLVGGAQDYSAALLARLERERDVPRILEIIAEIEGVAPEKIGAFMEIVSGRLAFALKGAFNSDPANYARLAMAVRRLNVTAIDEEALRGHLWEQNRFIAAAGALSAREAAEFAAYLLRDRPHDQRRMAELIALLPHNMLGEVLLLMRGGAAQDATAAVCRGILFAPQIHPALLVWALRNHEAFAGWDLPTIHDLLIKSVNFLEERHSGEGLRMQNTVRGLFENAKWFNGVFAGLNQLQRQALFERVQASATWEPAARHKLLTLMAGAEPQLTVRRKTAAVAETVNERLTSWRSLAARQEAYRHLVEVEMRQNRRDIAEARSYGDLRENFEYQSARQQQGMLLQRLAEMDADLRQVRGADFANAATDVAGPGTAVTYETAAGERFTYHILGEWDRDEALAIISNKSRLALSLLGRRVGDQAAIPGLAGEVAVRITAIEPLPQSVRDWIAGAGAEQAPAAAGPG